MRSGFDPTDDVYLIYVHGLRGPVPQKIPAPAGKPPFVEAGLRVLARHKLAWGDRDKSFADLKTLYPPPAEVSNG